MTEPSPPTAPAPRRWPVWAMAAAGGGGVVVVGVVLAALLWPATPPVAAADEDEDLDQLAAVVNPGYVGIETCAECHKDRVAAVKTTRHVVACTTGSGATADGFEPGRGRFEPHPGGARYEMTRSGGGFVATAVEPTPTGEKKTPYTIGLVYGAGNKKDENYFAWQGDRLIRPPVAWLHEAGCWGTDVDTLKAGDVHPSCLECHNTWVTHKPGAPIRYRTDDILLGVTCERCHGPGREHVDYHRQHPKGPSVGILHPGTLPRERLMDVCAQCHGNSRLVGKPFTYKPGQPLNTTHYTAHALHREDETTTNQVEYLTESKCYQKSKMTCVTCHNPHSPDKAGSAACLECHTPDKCRDRPSQPEGVRNDCAGCHMPRQVWMNSHFYTTAADRYLPVGTRAEHRIGKYPWAKWAVELDWHRKQPDAKSKAAADELAAKLADYWRADAEERLKEKRFKAAVGSFREAEKVAPDPATRTRMQEAIASQTKLDELMTAADEAERRGPNAVVPILKSILELTPDDARTHGRLGTLLATTGRGKEAVPHLEAVAKLDRHDTSGLTRLAWMAMGEGRTEAAADFCARADTIDPDVAGNHFVWGLVLLRQEKWADAEAQFRRILAVDLTDSGANRGLSEALRAQGQAKEAVKYGRRAVRWGDPRDAEILLTLGEAYAAAGRTTDARGTFQLALPAAEATNKPLAARIHERLDRLK